MREDNFQVNLGDETNNDMFQNDSDQVSNETNGSIKKIIKPIIIIIVLLIILYVVYFFFFGRYAEVTFSVLAVGKSAMTTIALMQDGEVYGQFNTDESVKVLPGDYEISINDPSLSDLYFPASTKFINISKEDATDIIIELYPEWSGKLKDFKMQNKPSAMFEGQTIDFSLSVNSENKSPQSIKIKGTGDLNGIDEYWTIKPGPNTTTVKFQNTKKYANNAKVTGSLEIENAPSSLKIPFSVDMKKVPTLTVSGSTSYTVSAGQDLTITLDLTNQSKQDKIESLNLEITNGTIDPNTIEAWIKTKSQDVNVPANGKTSVQLTMTIPLATPEKDISFDLVLKNSYLSVNKNIKLQIKAPAIELPKTTDFGTIVSGESAKTKNIVFDNKTGFQIKINNTTVDITTPSPNNSIDALLQTVVVEAPEVVEANSKANIPVSIIIPSTFETDALKGTITFETDAGNFSTEFTMNIKGIELKLDFVNFLENYTFQYDSVTNFTKQDVKIFNLTNNSNIDLNIWDMTITKCTTYVELTTKIVPPQSLAKKENKEFVLTYKGNMPKIQIPMDCSLDVQYLDPRTGANALASKVFILN